MSDGEYIYGIHAVNALLESEPNPLLELLLLQQRDDQRLLALEAKAAEHGVSLRRVERDELDRLVAGNHQGAIARCMPRQAMHESQLADFVADIDGFPLLLLLDGITDPHNLGACLRSAEAAGAHAVIVPKDKSADITPLVRKIASGAAEFIPVFKVTNLARIMIALQQQGVWLVGLADEAETSLYDIDLKGPVGLVLGAEGSGLRRLTREKCDYLASIPMPGTVASLNVSVATGVCVFEAVRQRVDQAS
ncbi:MAG: 23S rRNA (guanosine(2251)-2'-O)-methyltransferase RlmB [Pseudomonadales bacterium]